MRIEYLHTEHPRVARQRRWQSREENTAPMDTASEQGRQGDEGRRRKALSRRGIRRNDVEKYLLKLDGTMHNALAARILCTAATWAYSDLQTFASMMWHRGLYGEFVGITVTNQACLVDTTAYLFLSHTSKLAILAFRGTEPTNIINWLSNATTYMESQEEGSVHGGFLNSCIVMVPILKPLLVKVFCPDGKILRGKSCPVSVPGQDLKEAIVGLVQDGTIPSQVLTENIQKEWKEELALAMAVPSLFPHTHDREEEGGAEGGEKVGKEAALYICGHSLGGAFAAMAAAMIQLDPPLEVLRQHLRSVYTFGAPMFADETFAEKLDAEIGDKVFLHRYKQDIVPRMPGRIQGKFKHFGRAYVNSKANVWVRAREFSKGQVLGIIGSNVVGIMAFFMRNLSGLQRVPLPVSWADHSPLHYMRTSQSPRSGWEILGPELTSELADLQLFLAERTLSEGGPDINAISNTPAR